MSHISGSQKTHLEFFGQPKPGNCKYMLNPVLQLRSITDKTLLFLTVFQTRSVLTYCRAAFHTDRSSILNTCAQR